MMSSNILSRFLPPTDSQSVYEAIRQNDADSETSDTEERANLIPGNGIQEGFSDRELDDAADTGANELSSYRAGPTGRRRKTSRARWMTRESLAGYELDDRDGDVPQSLLVEGNDDEELRARLPPPPHSMPGRSFTSSPPHTPEATQRRGEGGFPRQTTETIADNQHILGRWLPFQQHTILTNTDPKKKAMWRWANVQDLDNFLRDVYIYFLGNGFWSILLSRLLNLFTFAFVVGFSTFLTNCIDYSQVPGSKTLNEILIPQCTSKMSGGSTFLLWLLSFFWIGKLLQYLLDIRRLSQMHDFYFYLLGVADAEVQTISWQEVVSRLMTLRDDNPATAAAISTRHRKFMGSQSKQRMDAHDIANRLMRRENYMIALVNKDIMDLTLPIPFLRNRQLFSRTLEWNLNLCIMDYVFNEQGQLRSLFLKSNNRRALSDGLRRRFIFAGVMNIFVAPFLVVYFMIHYFFTYFNEFKKNPSQIGSRQYTPLAEWKFREFNELWHLFERRANMSYPFASRYIDQFPKDKTAQVGRFVAFVSGALASVLALVSVIDPELFLGFEITHDRTVLFYLGVFGTIWAFARGLAPEETEVFDPEYALRELIDFTHYCPSTWNGRLHSDDVRKEFAVLYQMKIVIFLEEILSMIFTPFVLWFSLPKCSDRLIDFFREFTVHVDGMGYLCSFAVFDFKKSANDMSRGRRRNSITGKPDPRSDYFSTKDGKMLASYYGFLDNYGHGNGNQPNSRRHFHPPPGLPTLQTNSTADLIGYPDRNDLHSRPGAAGAYGLQSMLGGSRFRPMIPGDQRSPGPSMLLDPHHQPSASGFRVTRGTNYQRSRLARPTKDSVVDEEQSQDIRDSSAGQPATVGASSGGVTDSNLGDSWRMNTTPNVNANADADDDNENIDEIAGGAGVLGLLQQFQKANTDGRRTNVGI
ncbi:hypothetical protein N7523_002354 [Penicillium sp. IBT 18751x]|nr:hypothetical protein N7523_002354 [Penicillium sp. IBT 18751x]